MRTLVALACFLLVALAPARAWMPYTHVWLAEEALKEAAATGMVTIWQIDPESGRRIRKVGRFAVDKALVAAILAHRGAYHAGIIGPDAYPDMLTGDFAIHPDNEQGAGPIADDWLERLWRRSRGNPAAEAFVAGFLQHAAGDMFAHDFINYYTGGAWEVAHHNALKHTTIEQYCETLTPPPDGDPHFFDLSADEVAPFMVDTLIHSPLLAGEGGRYSLPAWIEALRTAPVPLPADEEQSITREMGKWPLLATAMARAVMFNPTRRIDWAAADDVVHGYLTALDGMITEQQMYELYRRLKPYLPAGLGDTLEWCRQVRKMQHGIAVAMVQHVEQTMPDLAGLQQALEAPASVFDTVLGSLDPNYPDHTVTLEALRHDRLHMEPFQTTFNYRRFAPAYNTVVACQLVLLPHPELKRLVASLHRLAGTAPDDTVVPPNLMLGFMHDLDVSHQWREPGFVLDAKSFRLIFADQGGLERASSVLPRGRAPAGALSCSAAFKASRPWR
ncbi:MAG: hypothetical protein ACYCW6_09985 [Candidatus Xenobia bacterium]